MKKKELDGILWRTYFGRGYMWINKSDRSMLPRQEIQLLVNSNHYGHNHMTSCWTEKFVIDFAWVLL